MRTWTILVALALAAGGPLYMRLHWRCAPQAYRAIMVLAICCFVAGSLAGAWVMHLAPSKPAEVVTASSSPVAREMPVAQHAEARKPEMTRLPLSAPCLANCRSPDYS